MVTHSHTRLATHIQRVGENAEQRLTTDFVGSVKAVVISVTHPLRLNASAVSTAELVWLARCIQLYNTHRQQQLVSVFLSQPVPLQFYVMLSFYFILLRTDIYDQCPYNTFSCTYIYALLYLLNIDQSIIHSTPDKQPAVHTETHTAFSGLPETDFKSNQP